MKKLTSKSTIIHKKVFPIAWFGFLIFFIVSYLTTESAARNGIDFMFVGVPIFMMAAGYFMMKKMIFDLIDEVYDEG